MYLVSVNSFQKLVRLILKINPNQAFCRENVTVTSEKCMVDPWIIRYPCMEVKNLLFFLCVYSFWQLTLRCIQNCFDCCYRWLGSGSTRRKGETSFIVNTAVPPKILESKLFLHLNRDLQQISAQHDRGLDQQITEDFQ